MPSRDVSFQLDQPWRDVLRVMSKHESMYRRGKRLKAALTLDKADGADVNRAFSKFRDTCNDSLHRDLDISFEIKSKEGQAPIRLEDYLWKTHWVVNDWYRKQLASFARGKKKQHVVERRKFQKLFLEFIKSSQMYYRSHVAWLAQTRQVPELEEIAAKFLPKELSSARDATLGDEERSMTLKSCFKALINLGDLSRWREEIRAEGEANFSPAVGFYDLARALCPESGRPHHQLATIATDDLRIAYHLFRSLTAVRPHPNAEENLDLHFRKVMSQLTPQQQHARAKRLRDEQATVHDLISWHMQLHAKCRTVPDFPDYAQLERNILSYIRMNVLQINMGSILTKLVLVNIAAEFVAKEKLENAQPLLPTDVHTARLYTMKFNVQVMRILLEVLCGELERVGGGVEGSPRPLTTRAGDFVTPVMHRVLPSLVNCSSWLLTTAEMFCNVYGDGPFFAAFSDDVNQFWSTYAHVLTLIVDVFAQCHIPEIEYLLPEDEETLGFKPFQDIRCGDRFLWRGERRVDSSKVSRLHPNKEMLTRLRRIIVDGNLLADLKTIPLHFIHRKNGRHLFYLGDVKEQPLPRDPSMLQQPFIRLGAAAEARRSADASDNETSEERMVRLMMAMVDGKPACAEDKPLTFPFPPPASPPRGPPKFQLRPPRVRTPPAYTFEDPLDVDPFGEERAAHDRAHRGRVERLEAAAAAQGRARRSYDQDPVEPDAQAKEWFATEIGQVQEPVPEVRHFGYSTPTK